MPIYKTNLIKDLQSAINNYFDERSAIVDKIQSDSVAIKRFTKLEMQQQSEEDVIANFQQLLIKYNLQIEEDPCT